MTKTFFFLSAILVALVCAATATYAQSYPWDDMKDSQADSIITVRHTEISGLQAQLSAAKSATDKATADAAQRLADNTKCREALYAMMGTDRNGFNAYRETLARDEQELSNLRALSASQLGESKARVDALEAQIRAMRDNKIVLIPDHMRRVQSMSTTFVQMKKGMVPANTMYTVGTWRKDRDCLWNIAKKPDIYNDPFAWPKIWHANQEQIHNPDIIQPGMQLTILKSPVTEQDKDMTGYRHRRH